MSAEIPRSPGADAYQSLVQAVSDEAFFLLDGRFRIVSWSPAAESLTGYSAAETFGRPLDSLWEPGFSAAASENSLDDSHVCTRLVCKNGERRSVLATRFCLPGESDCRYGMRIRLAEGPAVLGFSDNNGSLSSSVARHDSTKLLEAIAKNTTDAVFVKDRDGRYLLFNEAAARFVGKPVEAVLGRDDTELFDQESARFIRGRDLRVMQRNEAETEEEHVTAAGITRTFLATKAPYRGAEGEVLGVIGISRDISERKRRELQLQRVEQRLREAQRIARIGSWLWEPGTGHVWWSDEIYRMFDLEPNSISPSYEAFVNLIHPEDRDGFHARIGTLLEAGDWIEHEFRIATPLGRELWIHSCGQATRDINGTLIRLEGTDQDVTERKRAEKSLRRSHAFLQAIIQQAGEGISAARLVPPPANVEFLFWNDRMKEITGYTCDEINRLGWHATMYPDPEVRRRAIERMNQLREGRQLRSEEWEIQARNGEKRTLSISTSVVEGDDGRPVIVSLYSDVTERKRMEAELQASEVRFRTFVDHASDAMFVHAPGGRVLDVNRRACESLGYSREELIGMTPADFDAEVSPEISEEIRRKLLLGETVSFDSRHRRRDGSTFPVEVRLRPFEVDGESFGISLTRDITERKRAQDRLLQSEQRLRALGDAIPQIVWSSGPDGAIDHFNAWTERFTGIPAAQLNGWSWGQAIHPDDLQHVLDVWGDIVQTGVPREIEFRIRRTDGSYRWHVGRQTPARRVDGTVDRWYGTCTDIDDQKRIETSLRDERDRFTRLANTAPGILHSFRRRPDGSTSFPYASPRIYDVFGLRPEELREDAVRASEVIHPDDLPQIAQQMHESMRTLNDWRCTYRVLHPTRGEIWVEGHSSPVQEPDGSILWHGYITDVTERKRAEESLIDSETRFRRFMNSGPQIAFLKDEEGRYLYVNDNFEKIARRSLSESLGRTDFELFPLETAADFRANDLRALREGRLIIATEFAQHDDGLHESIVYKFPLVDRDGRTLLGGMAIDVTQQRQSEELLRAVMASVTDAIFSTDERGVVRSVNAATKRILGLDERQTVGRRLSELLPQAFADPETIDSPNSFLSIVDQMREGRHEISVRRQDGSSFPAEFSLSEFRIRGERRFTGVLRDITEHKRLEEQFRQSQKMQAVGQLASGVAHDLNNLLTIIYGYCFLLLQELQEESDGREAVQAIRDAGMRAAALTRQLLTFSRKTIVKPKVLNLNEVVEGVSKMLKRLIGEDVRLVTELDPKLVAVKMDPGQIEQVLMNFAVNSRDAMPAGGELLIQTSNFDLRPEESRFYPECRPGRYVRILVCDTGEGIEESIQFRIFEPFFTTKPVGKGTGLGLATVFGIVNQAGGHVSVESRKGHGARFTVLLPATKEVEKRGSVASLPVNPRGVETILLVEDDAEVRRLMADILDRLGYRVLEASSGREAIRLFEALPAKVDLLLTDVVMPEMGGRQLADELRAMRADLRVVYVSGHADDAVLRARLGNAPEKIIQKPFDPNEFAERVRAALDG